MLSCSWDGGAPKALVWWEGPGGQGKVGQENSNILILRYGTARSGKPYTCHAKHPLLLQTQTCRLTLGEQYISAETPHNNQEKYIRLTNSSLYSLATCRGPCVADTAQSCVRVPGK